MRRISLRHDQRGISSAEYTVLFVVICVGALAVWSKLSSDVNCRMQAAEAEFTARLSGKPRAAVSAECSSGSASGSHGAETTSAASTDPGTAASSDPGTARSELPQTRAPAGGAAKTAQQWTDGVVKVMCPQDKAFLDQLRARGVHITAYDKIYFEDPYYDGKGWTTRRFDAGGTTSGTQIDMIRSGDANEDASIIFHEGVHTGQPNAMAWRDKEYEAYIKEDSWRILHKLPAANAKFRTKDASGKEVTNAAAIRAFVDKEYPGVTASPSTGTVPDQIIGRTKKGDTMLQRADGSMYSRPPKAGDCFAADKSVTVPKGGIPIDMAQLRCP